MTQPQIRRRGGDAPFVDVHSPAELLARLYALRSGEAPPGLGALAAFAALRGLDAALDTLEGALRDGAHLLVVGDYDADGATGTALAVRGLRALGAARVSYLIPSRFDFGYGLSPAVAEAAHALGPDLLITVDNGISSVAGVARARELGLAVLVTDHHLPGERLPEAAAIVNPNQPGCDFPSKDLAGVGVVFYLLMALRARLRERGWFGAGRAEPNLATLLDLVALGTVADVVTLDRNNRILVEQGLRRIRAGHCGPGVRALLRVAGRDPMRASATDLAFAAAPRLNAAGRLEDMSVGVECLLSDDAERANALAQQLDAINRRRREIEGEMKAQAETAVQALDLAEAGLPAALCLYGADWHQGVSGIVAARIRERYHRPVIAFADGGDGLLRGSARSIDGLHVRDAIDRVDRAEPGLIARFGGHAMAAGLSLRAEAFEPFRARFAAVVEEMLEGVASGPELVSDGPLPARLLTLETAETLRLGGPWGKGFPEPRFDGEFEVLQARLVGERHLKLRVAPPEGGSIEAIGFDLAEQLALAHGRVRLAYRLDVNDYRGRRSPQLILESVQPI
ncbi:single-stranded-DNA-specific exonuclease RecJ [Marichromatium sp. PS1]|uniref:single-stranded-DNA-specific exonuclease RecJ n=1 Tax=Marichromatium sp. PS1 TaxID=3138932 RepID=UPI0032E6270D